MPSDPPEMKHTPKKLFFTIWIAALLLNSFLLFLYYWPNSKVLVGDENYYINEASIIYRGMSHEQLPLWQPGYSKFLALSFSLTDATNFPLPLLFFHLVQILLWIVGGIMYWKITVELLPAYCIRILALSLFILNPTLAAFSHYFWPEIPHLTLYLIALWALITYPTSLIWNAAVGILLAMAALLKLVYYPVSISFMSLIFVLRFSRKAKLTHALIAPLFFFLVLSPTLLHNFKVHNKLMTGDSSVFQLWVGLNDQDLTDWGENAITSREIYYYLRSAQTHNERNEIYLSQLPSAKSRWLGNRLEVD